MKHFISVLCRDVVSFSYGSLDESVLNIHIVKGLRHFLKGIHNTLQNAAVEGITYITLYKDIHRVSVYVQCSVVPRPKMQGCPNLYRRCRGGGVYYSHV
jgi:hypothetical protein